MLVSHDIFQYDYGKNHTKLIQVCGFWQYCIPDVKEN